MNKNRYLINQARASYLEGFEWEADTEKRLERVPAVARGMGLSGERVALVQVALLTMAGDEEVCWKCHGTGLYRWPNKFGGMNSGKCFHCSGKGYTDTYDRRRTEDYWSNRAAREMRG